MLARLRTTSAPLLGGLCWRRAAFCATRKSTSRPCWASTEQRSTKTQQRTASDCTSASTSQWARRKHSTNWSKSSTMSTSTRRTCEGSVSSTTSRLRTGTRWKDYRATILRKTDWPTSNPSQSKGCFLCVCSSDNWWWSIFKSCEGVVGWLFLLLLL